MASSRPVFSELIRTIKNAAPARSIPYAPGTAADRAPGSVPGAWGSSHPPSPSRPATDPPVQIPGDAPPPTSTQPNGWRIDVLSGRFVEISSWGQTVSITAAASLILEAQLRGEPAAWVAVSGSTFFPPDFAECGIDLDALPVVRVPHTLPASRAAEELLRSGGFGVIVLDLGRDTDMRIAVNARLAALAKKHDTVLLCLTQKEPAVPSLGPLVSLRTRGVIRRSGFNHFTWQLEVLRDKRRGLGWSHGEVCRGPDGLC